MEEDYVIKIEGVSKMYKLFGTKADRMKEALSPLKRKYHNEFYALHDINLYVKRGEILGIVGMNGSGKSTLLKVISGIIPPTSGSVVIKGNVVPLIELGSGFNPEFSGLDNIYFYNSILGYSRRETDQIIDKILAFAEIGEFIHQPLKTYSSGMKARLSFAVSVNINPEILILDEVLSVGDELFRRKSFAKIEEFFKAGKTILFVSHSEGSINQLCSRAVMLNHGRIVLNGPTKFVTMNYAKFMFSNHEQKAALLKEFGKNGGNNLSMSDTDIAINTPKLQVFESPEPNQKIILPYLIPNFIPKSTIITCNAKIKATDTKIETLAGVAVNALVQNERYTFSYRLDFFEDLGYLNYGIGFKTEKGVQLSWKVFPGKLKYVDHKVVEGTSIRVSWTFNCLFMPGTYYINIGVRKQDPVEEKLLYKAADIFVFRVLPHEVREKGGLFDTHLSAIIQGVE